MFGILTAAALLMATAQAGQGQAQAQAQEQEQEQELADDTNVCLATAIRWRGANDDIRRIAEAPVPDSYRRYFDGEGCTRWQLREEDLVDWHLAFGNERTAAAALAFLEADYLRGRLAPAAYPGQVADAWRSAQADLRAAQRVEAQTSGSSQLDEMVRRSRSLQRLRVLMEAHGSYLFLAQHYLRAAEFYGSPALFENARSYRAAVLDPFRLVYGDSLTPAGLAETSLGGRLGLEDWHVGAIHDLEMRFAIMQARLSLDPADIDAAELVVTRNYDPLVRSAVRQDERRSLCDLGDEPPEGQEGDEAYALRRACERENYFVWRVIDFWRNRAQLDLLMASDPVHYGIDRGRENATGSELGRIAAPGDARAFNESWNVGRAVRILTRAIEDSPAGTVRENGLQDQLIGLYLLNADAKLRFSALRRRLHPDTDLDDVDPEGQALQDLREAAAFAFAAERPGRFRQIATRYLAVHGDVVARVGVGVDGPRFPSVDRQASYFRHVLADLEEIAVGR